MTLGQPGLQGTTLAGCQTSEMSGITSKFAKMTPKKFSTGYAKTNQQITNLQQV